MKRKGYMRGQRELAPADRLGFVRDGFLLSSQPLTSGQIADLLEALEKSQDSAPPEETSSRRG
jgi:hypothetical protein